MIKIYPEWNVNGNKLGIGFELESIKIYPEWNVNTKAIQLKGGAIRLKSTQSGM